MQCLDVRTIGLERLRRPGPFVIACSHLSHLEPILLSSMVDSPVRWIARSEYYANGMMKTLLDLSGTIPIHRKGPPQVQAIRTAVRYLGEGQIVGIFPEGGVARGKETIFRGGVCKGGVATIALLAGVPVVPVLMLGTEKLNTVEPWYPGRRGRLWIAVGEPLQPRRSTRTTRRSLRHQLCDDLRARFESLHRASIEAFDLDPSRIP